MTDNHQRQKDYRQVRLWLAAAAFADGRSLWAKTLKRAANMVLDRDPAMRKMLKENAPW